MADAITVDFKNKAAFDAALAHMRDDVTAPTDALNAAGRELLQATEAAAPRATGRMAGASRLLPASGKQVRLMVDTPYAAVIHWGWPGHGIRRRPWVVATWLRNPAPMAKATDAQQSAIDKQAART
jgi:hypothetical protein